MLTPVDFSNIVTALQAPAGWLELLLVASCFAIGWMLDRRVRLTSASETRRARVSVGGVNRLVLPVSTMLLLVIAGTIYQRWQPTFFIAIALPLMIALAAIRLLVYAMRELFGTPKWMPASERAV